MEKQKILGQQADWVEGRVATETLERNRHARNLSARFASGLLLTSSPELPVSSLGFVYHSMRLKFYLLILKLFLYVSVAF